MLNIEPIKLLSGSHSDTAQTGQGCFMNVIAYLNGEPQITDQSPCVCVTIRPIAIYLNDFANDEQRQRLLPYVLRAMGTATDDKAEIEKRIAALVKFAEFSARLAESEAKYAAKYAAESAAEYAAKYAKSAAKSAAKYAKSAAESAAKYAAEYAAKYAKSAAKSAAESAKYAAESAKYAAESAKYAAESAKYAAEYAAKYAAESAAEYAAEYAESAAEYAEYAKSAEIEAHYHAVREAIFCAGLKFLETACNPAQEYDQCIIQRANELIALN